MYDIFPSLDSILSGAGGIFVILYNNFAFVAYITIGLTIAVFVLKWITNAFNIWEHKTLMKKNNEYRMEFYRDEAKDYLQKDKQNLADFNLWKKRHHY